MPQKRLEKIPGLKEIDIINIMKTKEIFNQIEEEYVKLNEKKIYYCCIDDPEYPEQFLALKDPPYGLFYRGELPKSVRLRVGIVGARMCTEYGKGMAYEIARELAAYQVPVISAMARGIDASGHRGALDGKGMTYAVFGCGVDICYPHYHRQLYYEILKHGGILSEYLPGTEPLAYHFPMRNRLISALCDVILIIEAKQKSGSLITADFALEQGKDVYALPGRVGDALSEGCNRLISQGAGILVSIDDFLEELSLQTGRKQKKCPQKKLPLEKEESLVYSCFGLLPVRLEEVLAVTGLDIQAVSRILAALQQKNLIEEVFKNYYKRTTENV